MNYLQIVTLTTSFNLNWPKEVLSIFKAQNSANSASDQLFSFDCLLQNDDSTDNVYYNKLIFMACMPLIIAIGILFFRIPNKICNKSIKKLKGDYVSTFVILIFLIHPNVIQALFSSFNCKEINSGEYWLVSDLDIRCWSEKHIFYSFTVALPGIIVWGLALPAIILLFIKKHKTKLNKLSVRIRFGFFYNGYRGSCYY